MEQLTASHITRQFGSGCLMIKHSESRGASQPLRALELGRVLAAQRTEKPKILCETSLLLALICGYFLPNKQPTPAAMIASGSGDSIYSVASGMALAADYAGVA